MSGVVFTPAAADRIGRAVRWVESRRQAGDQPVGPARGVEPVWVRLTSGTADGDGHYPGVITLYSGVGEAWSDYSAVKVAPLNGETLSNATRYAVRPSGRTPAGDELYTVIGGPAAGTITVSALDGSPSYAGTTLQLDEADGWVITQPSAGVVKLDQILAGGGVSGTGDGLMSGTAGFLQMARGDKFFVGHLSVGFESHAPSVSYPDDLELQAKFGGAGGVHPGAGAEFQTDTGYGELKLDGSAAMDEVGMKLRYGTGASACTEVRIVNGALVVAKMIGFTSSYSDAVYAIADNTGAVHNGATGTLADGSAVKGGIVTGVGSGNIDFGTW